MKITDVRVNEYSNKAVRGFASITIDDELVVTGFRILEGKKGLFLAFPSQAGKDGEYYDTTFPLNKDTRGYISDEILAAYEALDLPIEEEEEKPVRKAATRTTARRK